MGYATVVSRTGEEWPLAVRMPTVARRTKGHGRVYMLFSWESSFIKPLYFPASYDLLMARAYSLRTEKRTEAENDLFKLLHKLGEKLSRQVVIHNMIVDIAIPARNLLIEVDGSIHHSFKVAIERDKYKSAKLRELGFNLIRIQNEDVKKKQLIKNLLAHYPRRDRHKEAYKHNLRYANKKWETGLKALIQRHLDYSPDHLMFKWIGTEVRKTISALSQ